MPTLPSTQDAFRALYVDHHRWLVGWLRKRLGCPHQADDLAHDTFLRVLLARPDLQSLLEPRAYLTVAARRLIQERDRRQRLEQALLETWAVVHGAQAQAPSAQEVAEQVEQLMLALRLLEGLPDKARRAFYLSRVHGLPHAEIAATLGVSVSMVKQYIAKVLLHCLDGLS